jgi:hypothetical protein
VTDEQRARWEGMLENSGNVGPEDRVAYLVHERGLSVEHAKLTVELEGKGYTEAAAVSDAAIMLGLSQGDVIDVTKEEAS